MDNVYLRSVISAGLAFLIVSFPGLQEVIDPDLDAAAVLTLKVMIFGVWHYWRPSK